MRVVGVGPQLVEELDDLLRRREVRVLIGVVIDALLRDQFPDELQESVEGVVARLGRGVADPHRRAEVLGERLPEERRFGLLELGSREVLQVDVRDGGDLLADHREVVGRREAHLGLHAPQVDRLLELGGRRAADQPAAVYFCRMLRCPSQSCTCVGVGML